MFLFGKSSKLARHSLPPEGARRSVSSKCSGDSFVGPARSGVHLEVILILIDG